MGIPAGELDQDLGEPARLRQRGLADVVQVAEQLGELGLGRGSVLEQVAGRDRGERALVARIDLQRPAEELERFARVAGFELERRLEALL